MRKEAALGGLDRVGRGDSPEHINTSLPLLPWSA